MSVSLLAAILTVTLAVLSEGIYIISIMKGHTKPSRSSFWVWTLVQGMTAFSYAWSDGGYAIVLSATYALGFLLIAVLSIKHGSGRWQRLDTMVIFVAFLSAFFWALTGSAFVALLLLLVTDAIGAVPIIKKSWLRPWEESRLAWGLTCLATLSTLWSIEGWEFSDKIYIVYMLAINGSIMMLLLRPKMRYTALKQRGL